MRFLGVTALRYIKSEEITPVELMTANEWGIQAQHSARSGRRHAPPGGPFWGEQRLKARYSLLSARLRFGRSP